MINSLCFRHRRSNRFIESTVINLSPNSAITSFQKENMDALMKNKNTENTNK